MPCFDLSDFYQCANLSMAVLMDFYIRKTMGDKDYLGVTWSSQIAVPISTEQCLDICNEFGFTMNNCRNNFDYIVKQLGYKINPQNPNYYISNEPVYLAVHTRESLTFNVNQRPCY